MAIMLDLTSFLFFGYSLLLNTISRVPKISKYSKCSITAECGEDMFELFQLWLKRKEG